MPPLLLGKLPSGLGTPDFFVTISDEDRPLLRVDLYAGETSAPFTEAIAWENLVLVGCGDSIYVIDPHESAGREIALGTYFSHFYAAKDYLLVASAEELRRLSSSGDVMWRVRELGIDGVVVDSVQNELVQGQGEWDPPGGWKRFVVRLDSGKLVL